MVPSKVNIVPPLSNKLWQHELYYRYRYIYKRIELQLYEDSYAMNQCFFLSSALNLHAYVYFLMLDRMKK